MAKLDALGQHIWSQSFPVTASIEFAIEAMDVAADDSVVAVGYHAGPVDFGGGPSADPTGRSFFVVKVSSSGQVLWSKTYQPSGQAVAHDVAVDSLGHVYVVGEFDGTVDLGVGPPLTTHGMTDLFVLKLDSSGSAVWREGIGGAGDDRGTAVAVDPTDAVVIAGSVSSSVSLFGGPPVPGLFNNACLVKIDASGAHQFSLGTTKQASSIEAIVADSPNRIVLSGMHGTGLDLAGANLPLSNDGHRDLFVMTIDGSGVLGWVYNVVLSSGFEIGNLAEGPSGDLFVGGSMGGTVDFGLGPHTALGFFDMFVLRLDGIGGGAVWSRSYPSSGLDRIGGLGLDASGRLFVTGDFQSSLNLGPVTLMATSVSDAMVAELLP